MPDPIRMPLPNALLKLDGDSVSLRKKSGEAEQLKSACQDFESIFINQMMQQMRRTIPKQGLFDGGNAEEIYTSMMDSEMSKSISQQKGLGLADVLFRQMSTLVKEEK
jgi:flagellar protein FlgJ